LSGLALIVARFLLFSDLIKSSDEGALAYASFALWNAILPFVFLGVMMGQNALFPKLSKKEGDELANFYRVFLILVSVIAIVFFSFIGWGSFAFIYCYSLLQLAINMGYQQKRFEIPLHGTFLSCLEILVIGVLLVTNNPFEYLFYYYFTLAALFVTSQWRFFFNNLGLLMSLERYIFHLKNILLKSPTLIRDNIDLIILGLTASSDIAIIYATVVLASAPSKVLFSNIVTILNIYLADSGRFYSDFNGNIQTYVYLFSTFSAILAVVIIMYVVFPESSYLVVIAAVIRSVNLLMSAKQTTSYLDMVQDNHDDIHFLAPMFRTLASIVCCFFIFILNPSILTLSISGFIVGVFNYKVYGDRRYLS